MDPKHLTRIRQTYATVDEIILILRTLSAAGKGHYIVGCNQEYYLARKDEVPVVNDDGESVDLGGYT